MLRLFFFIFVILFSSRLFASDTVVKLKGLFEFQSAFHNHNSKDVIPNISAHNKDVAFNSSANIAAEINHAIDDFTNYGAKIALDTTTKNNRSSTSSLYITSQFGKIEAGSDKSVMNKMKITGYSVGAGSLGNWDSWSATKTISEIVYVVNFGNFLDSKMRTTDKAEYSRKISYYTPKIGGLQFGITYIPDSSNLGYGDRKNAGYSELDKPLKQGFAVKNAMCYGVSWNQKPNDDFGINVAFVMEKGTTVLEPGSTKLSGKFTNLSNYILGTQIDYKDFSIASSYGNYMRSFTSSTYDKNRRDTSLYSIGGRYNYSPFTSSIHYFSSNHKKNKFQAITLATDYTVAKGMITYVEATQYLGKGSYIKNDKVINSSAKGTLFIVGCKVLF